MALTTTPFFEARTSHSEGLASKFGTWRAWHPEWPVMLLVAAAWLVLAAAYVPGGGTGGTGGSAGAASHLHHAHVGNVSGGQPGVVTQLPGWTLMAVAMMVPAALPAVGYVALNSLRQRQRRAMALYVAAYVAVWLPLGAAALAAHTLVVDRLGTDRLWLVVGSVLVAGAWQMSREKRRAVIRCARTVPLPPRGVRADKACLRFGLQQGTRCLTSCWALMLVMVTVGHTNLVVMAALTAWVLAEERTQLGRRLLLRSASAH